LSAEAQTTLDKPANSPKYKRLTNSDRAYILKAATDGLTQVEIAKRIGCSQTTVSEWLNELQDSTDLSKQYLRGQALKMAQDIVKDGRPADKVATLKGLSVLHDEQQSSVTVIVGGAGQVNIGVGLSPAPTLVQGETLQISQQNPTVSDK
jgi:IS30 family transposase